MDKRLFDAFDNIQADDELKEKTKQYLQGTIEKRRNPSRVFRMRRLATAMASLILLLSVSLFSANLYFTADAHIDLDVNPSLAITLNRFGRVIEVKAYNDDGGIILRDVAVAHKTYDEAVQQLLESMIANGYMEQNGVISITVQTNNSEKETNLIETLESAVSEMIVSHHVSASTEVYAVSEDIWTSAHGHNLSPAKYLAILELQDVDETATFEDCAEHSIGEIRQRTQNHGEGHHDELSDLEEETIQETEEKQSGSGQNGKSDGQHNGSDHH